MLHMGYQNVHSASKVRTNLGNKAILSSKLRGLSEGNIVVLRYSLDFGSGSGSRASIIAFLTDIRGDRLSL